MKQTANSQPQQVQKTNIRAKNQTQTQTQTQENQGNPTSDPPIKNTYLDLVDMVEGKASVLAAKIYDFQNRGWVLLRKNGGIV